MKYSTTVNSEVFSSCDKRVLVYWMNLTYSVFMSKCSYHYPSLLIIPHATSCGGFIPHATSCGGYNVFDPSVSQSVSQSVSSVLVSATPLKPLNRISWNFVVMKDIMWRCTYSLEILIQLLFLELRPLWT